MKHVHPFFYLPTQTWIILLCPRPLLRPQICNDVCDKQRNSTMHQCTRGRPEVHTRTNHGLPGLLKSELNAHKNIPTRKEQQTSKGHQEITATIQSLPENISGHPEPTRK
uniref:Uncharacterized protein n=1 Tax=Eutreptiella gymnastica TaxID=73025 RepID=A0A7S4FRP6_9EUGL